MDFKIYDGSYGYVTYDVRSWVYSLDEECEPSIAANNIVHECYLQEEDLSISASAT